MDRFGAVFKLDLTEETRTQSQEEEAIASSCLILATPTVLYIWVCVLTVEFFNHLQYKRCNIEK